MFYIRNFIIFERYASIDNSYKEKEIKKMAEIYPDIRDRPFFIEEKIDGANFSIWFDRHGFKFAKRSGFVGEGENFFDHLSVMDRYKDHVSEVISTAVNMFGLGKDFSGKVVLYGEIFGPSIQNRINYGNEKDFRAFDVKIIEDEDNSYFVSRSDMEFLLYLSGHNCSNKISLVPEFGEYTLQECLDFDVDRKSIVARELLDTDDIDKMEGIVIKPCDPTLVDIHGRRFVLKKKSPDFEEKKKSKAKKSKNEKEPLPDHLQAFVDAVDEYLTENRVYSAISKHGEPSQSDFGKLLTMTVDDAIEDYERDNDVILTEKLSSKDAWLVNKEIKSQAVHIVRLVFLQYM